MTGEDGPARDETTVTVERLSQSYGDVSVLDGVDLTVEPGEFVALVGPNGAGKTTLLRSINGILDPAEGAVALDGTPVGDLSSKAVSRQVATVPQDSHVGFSFTTEQIVEMGRTPHQSRLDWGTDSEPIERALERTATVQFRDRPVDDLSGGERQRVLLARALAQEPSVLVLDEPTASLDINHQIGMLRVVRELVEEGKTAIAAIHDLDLAARFCERLCLLADGEIRARGEPDAVLAADELATAFGTRTAVTRNPVTGTPAVAALPDRPDVDGRVHVVGGGATGERVVRTLWRAGFDLSVGPLPAGDRTAALAAELGCPAVTAPPFEPVSASHREAVTELASEADALVVSDGAGTVPDVADRSPCIRAAFTDGTAGGPTTPARGDGGQPPTGDVGVDRSDESWVAVAFTGDGFDHASVFDSIGECWSAYEERARRILVGVPIGLVESGDPDRRCDELARSVLGERSAAVRTPPVREATRKQRYSTANRVHKRKTGHELSERAFAHSEPIAAVDDLVRNVPEARTAFAESHPELCFRAFAGEPLQYPETTARSA